MKKRRTGIITGLILGGAVASVLSMLFVGRKKKGGIKGFLQPRIRSKKAFWKSKKDQTPE